MFNFAKRNILVFLRNRSAVFFSFLGVFIVIGLYVLFLGDTYSSGLEHVEGIGEVMDNWVMAGIISVASITTAMGAFQAMVTDKETKRIKDMKASPLKKSAVAGGYILSAYSVGVVMSIFTFIVAEIYIVVNGGSLIDIVSALKVIGIIFLAVFASSSMVFFLVSFLSSSGAFSTASIILGTVIGFLTGIYIPVGTLPEGVQWVVKCFPVTHSAALIKQVMTASPVERVFDGAPEAIVTGFSEKMGIYLTYGDYTATTGFHIAVLAATGVLFFLLAVLNVSRQK